MDQPNYVLKANEAVLMPIEQRKEIRIIIKIMKAVLCVLAAVWLLCFLLFQDNILSDMPFGTWLLLIGMVVYVFINSKKDYFPSPMELQFYDEYLVLYLPKRYYSRKVTRMEINRMNYADITKCAIKLKSQRVHLYGSGTSTFYNYKSDGTCSSEPTQVRNYKEGLIYFSIRLEEDIDFKNEIETHSPLQVIVENN